MSKINIVFWTQGGNTQMMAEAIADGVRDAGKEAEVVFVRRQEKKQQFLKYQQ